MKLKHLALVMLLLLPGLATIQPLSARPRWELLGSREVDYKLDRDVIPVTWRDGFFDAIRIVVKGGSLNMHKCIIHFENGGVKEIELKQIFTKGSLSRLIDLPGNNRMIEKIVFWYDTKNFSNNKATVMVFGRH